VAALPHDRRPEDEAARFLDLAAFADGRLDAEDQDRVAALLAADPAAAADVRSARTLDGTEEGSTGLEPIIARACAIFPDADYPRGQVIALAPRRSRRPLVQSFAQWGSIAAAIAVASWLGFAMGSDASLALSNPRQPSDAGFSPIVRPASGLCDLGRACARDRRLMARSGVRQHLFWLVLTLSLTQSGCRRRPYGSFHGPPQRSTRRLQQIEPELALNPQQKQAFDVYAHTVRVRMQSMRDAIEPVIGNAWSELAKPDADETRVMQLFDDGGATTAQLSAGISNDDVVAPATLSPEQGQNSSSSYANGPGKAARSVLLKPGARQFRIARTSMCRVWIVSPEESQRDRRHDVPVSSRAVWPQLAQGEGGVRTIRLLLCLRRRLHARLQKALLTAQSAGGA
jgi:hypothetical protein